MLKESGEFRQVEDVGNFRSLSQRRGPYFFEKHFPLLERHSHQRYGYSFAAQSGFSLNSKIKTLGIF